MSQYLRKVPLMMRRQGEGGEKKRKEVGRKEEDEKAGEGGEK